MRSLRSENKATKLRSLEHWADIEVRSAVRCAATRRIEGAGPIDRTWPIYARWRRGTRRNRRFEAEDWALVLIGLKQQWSPEQISGWLRRKRRLAISHETIYRYIWEGRRRGGELYRHLRSPKQRRKRYGRYDSRGRLAGKRLISERPTAAENRSSATSKVIRSSAAPTNTAYSRSSIVRLRDGKLEARSKPPTVGRLA